MADPLDKEDLQALNDSLKALQDAEEQAKRGTEAGLDMSVQMERITRSREQITNLKRAFFPRTRS